MSVFWKWLQICLAVAGWLLVMIPLLGVTRDLAGGEGVQMATGVLGLLMMAVIVLSIVQLIITARMR